MPKIRIKEQDSTGRVQGSAISNVVYLPIRFNKDSVGSTQITKATEGVGTFSSLALFTSVSEFEDAAKTTVKVNNEGNVDGIAIIDEESLGYRLCVHLLNLGYQVLVEALDDASTPSWSLLGDKSLYDVRFLTLGAMTEDADYTASGIKEDTACFNMTGEVSKMVACAATRGDCIALVNADENNPNYNYAVEAVREGFDGTNGEYAAAFSPWFYTKNSDFVIDPENEPEVKIPAAFGYLFAYANATKNSPEWYAIAGFERGIIPELSRVCHSYTTAEIEILQARAGGYKDPADKSKGLIGEVELDHEADNVGFAINPIAYVRPAGYIIYGNRTLRVNDASKKLIASSFLNIRNGLCAIKKVMYEASRKYTFEQNTETLWINFQSYITPLLDRMQAGNGILGYTFIRQKTDAKARLKARLNLIPVEAVEDFDLEVRLADDLTVSE